MALLLTESDLRILLTMPLALDAVETSFCRLADGCAILHSRQRLHVPGQSYLHYMAAGDSTEKYMGLKIYSSSREGLRFLVPLFRSDSGDLVALLEADYLGQMRTGAASGIATKYMAREDARVVGIVGTGLQARTQLEAVAAVRKLEKVRVYGRDEGRRVNFARQMTVQLQLPVEPAATPEETVRGADIIITATTAANPVVEGGWLRPGTHINAIGANFPQKRELDDQAVLAANVIATDFLQQSREESGDLIHAFGNDEARWKSVHELSEIVAGRVKGRANDQQITLFKSNGIAIEDIVVAGRVYEAALKRGMGKEIPLWTKAETRESGPRT